MKNYIQFFTLLIILSLIACSPHPGAGNWQADGSNSLNVSRINVVYEGTADFYVEGHEASIRRCFWSAIAEQTLQMQCVFADNIDKKVNYQFIVTKKGHAKLMLDSKLIGLFTAQTVQAQSN